MPWERIGEYFGVPFSYGWIVSSTYPQFMVGSAQLEETGVSRHWTQCEDPWEGTYDILLSVGSVCITVIML